MFLINRLKEVGEKNNSILLKIYSLLLGGKLELIQGDIRRAGELYRKSLHIAQEYNLSEFISQSSDELDNLQRDLGNWEKLLQDSSIKERIELINLEEYIKKGKEIIL